jgi:serine/threonine protein kinase
MHKTKNIMHRDIKLENLLCYPKKKGSRDINIKLTDFGFSCYFKENEKQDLPLGSPLYMAPEIMMK